MVCLENFLSVDWLGVAVVSTPVVKGNREGLGLRVTGSPEHFLPSL